MGCLVFRGPYTQTHGVNMSLPYTPPAHSQGKTHRGHHHHHHHHHHQCHSGLLAAVVAVLSLTPLPPGPSSLRDLQSCHITNQDDEQTSTLSLTSACIGNHRSTNYLHILMSCGRTGREAEALHDCNHMRTLHT